MDIATAPRILHGLSWEALVLPTPNTENRTSDKYLQAFSLHVRLYKPRQAQLAATWVRNARLHLAWSDLSLPGPKQAVHCHHDPLEHDAEAMGHHYGQLPTESFGDAGVERCLNRILSTI